MLEQEFARHSVLLRRIARLTARDHIAYGIAFAAGDSPSVQSFRPLISGHWANGPSLLFFFHAAVAKSVCYTYGIFGVIFPIFYSKVDMPHTSL